MPLTLANSVTDSVNVTNEGFKTAS